MKERKSFSLPFRNGELWYSCLDELKDDYENIKNKLLLEEQYLNRPSTSGYIIYHLYNTDITYEIAEIIVKSFLNLQDKIKKMAIIGLSKNGKSNIKNVIKHHNIKLNFVIKYIEDFEEAKEWLL